MRLRLAAALAAAAALMAFTPAHADLLIQIDKSTQQMTVTADGDLLYTWPVSTGIARYDTPNGAFTPFRKEKDHYSREWDDAPMPYSIFFTMKGHAIHGTNHSSLGHPASHGCVRLSVKNASMLWDLVAKHKMKNTTIVLTGTIPASHAPAVAHAAPRSRTAVADPDQDDDQIASVPERQQVYGRNGWQVYDPPRAYDYRDRPYYYARPRGFFPFGW
jgi:hypothetical protein